MAMITEPHPEAGGAEALAAPHRVDLFGVQIDAVDMTRAVALVDQFARQPTGRCRYVVTPNVDHIVMLQKNRDFRRAYDAADLVLADGWPVVWAARRLGQPLPGLVPGSDLVPALLTAASEAFQRQEQARLRIFLLGAAPGVAARAAQRIERDWAGVTVVGQYSPPLGFERDVAESAGIIDRIAEARPDVLVVGLGAPKQELWVHRHRARIQAGVALCVGATIDFLAGERTRAPRWMRRLRLEWLHRMCSEPRRLIRRYVRGAWIFPQLVWRQWRITKCG